MILEDYLDFAKLNESIFREILTDLKENNRSKSLSFPKEIDLTLSLEEIYKRYSLNLSPENKRILYFKIDGNKALIGFEKDEGKKVYGAELRYLIKDNKVKFDTDLMDWEMSR